MEPFQIAVPDAQLDDLRRRLAETRWPAAYSGPGWERGVPTEYLKELATYWQTQFDWRAAEAEINKYPQFTTEIDGVNVHFLHVKSGVDGARPLLLTHSWPGSIVEFLDVVDALTDPPDPRDAFHLVIPSLPGYGFSGKPTQAGWGVERIAVAWAQLMDRLDYDRYGAQGGDWGSMVTAALGSAIPEALVGIHLTMPMALRPDPDDQPLSKSERTALMARKAFLKAGTGYAREQATRPQTLGYGLVDSPVALCTWIVEKFWDWSECAGDPCNAIRRDRLLDDVMLYWLPATGTSSIRLYWESYRKRRMDPVEVPTGVTQFRHEMTRLPRSWVQRRFRDLRYWSEPATGGHFAALEQPEVFVDEVRAFFRTVR